MSFKSGVLFSERAVLFSDNGSSNWWLLFSSGARHMLQVHLPLKHPELLGSRHKSWTSHVLPSLPLSKQEDALDVRTSRDSGYSPFLRSYSHSAPWNSRQEILSLHLSHPFLAFLQQSMARRVAACSAPRIDGCLSCFLCSFSLCCLFGVMVCLFWRFPLWRTCYGRRWLGFSLGESVKPGSPCVK